jgi:hypothetical protein
MEMRLILLAINFSFIFSWKSDVKFFVAEIALVTSLSTLSQPFVSHAQIPMLEDFYQTSGTFVGRHDSESTVEVLKSSGFGPIDSIKSSKTILAQLKPEVMSKDWDRVMLETKCHDLKPIRTKYFGSKNIQNLAKFFHTSVEEIDEIEGLREELAYQVEQLEDFARSNRIVYFNTEDIKQMKELSGVDDPTTGMCIFIVLCRGIIVWCLTLTLTSIFNSIQKVVEINMSEAEGYINTASDTLDVLITKIQSL